MDYFYWLLDGIMDIQDSVKEIKENGGEYI